ncbi:hypothetical protein LTR17_000019 [Elasticomyces elasticus]|nr:hypothetical protein LTR17_000019 [Elasticomyces elasticus]
MLRPTQDTGSLTALRGWANPTCERTARERTGSSVLHERWLGFRAGAASSRAQLTSRYGVATHQLPERCMVGEGRIRSELLLRALWGAGFGFSVSAWPLASVRTVTPSVGAARAGGLGYGD